jgi:hypothetical protein
MKQGPLVRSLSAVLVLTLGLMLVVAGGSGGDLTVSVGQSETEMYPGTQISGIASNSMGENVRVKMYVDGELVAIDNTMEGDENEFEFVLPPDSAGKTVRIVATDSAGNTVEKRYTVQG